MLNIKYVGLVGAALVSSSIIIDYINTVKPVWENAIKQQRIVNSESKRYGEKLKSLEASVMKKWASAYENVGDSDRVSLSKKLNIKGSGLTPSQDVPGIIANESIVNNIGGMQVSLGLRKVCFGQGNSGYEVKGKNINSVVSAMRDIEKRPGTDFEQFTIISTKDGLIINFYDLCVYLKEELLP